MSFCVVKPDLVKPISLLGIGTYCSFSITKDAVIVEDEHDAFQIYLSYTTSRPMKERAKVTMVMMKTFQYERIYHRKNLTHFFKWQAIGSDCIT